MRTTPDINKILRASPRDGRRGAPLGAPNYDDRPEGCTARVYCQRVRFTDGCYAPDGTYWGAPANLWCVFNVEGTLRFYVRAETRREALAAFEAAP